MPAAFFRAAPRQGSIAPANEALIKYKDDKSFTEALNGLSEFEYIWVIYEFHLNPLGIRWFGLLLMMLEN